jgi:hypothetical protein
MRHTGLAIARGLIVTAMSSILFKGLLNFYDEKQ